MKIMLPIQRLFVGRVNRLQFLRAVLLGIALPLIGYYLFLSGLLELFSEPAAIPATLLLPFFYIPIAVAYVILSSVQARRLHDAGMPGWYVLIPLLREISFILSFFLPGEREANQYGSVPSKKPGLMLLLNTSATSEDTGEKWVGVLLTILIVAGFVYSLVIA
jgi:uncharacterized membrane protein YhaH (DUF805 family)